MFTICTISNVDKTRKRENNENQKKTKSDVWKDNNTRACSKVETASGRRNVSASAGKALEIHPPKVLSISADTPLAMTTCLRYSFPFMKEKLSSSPEPYKCAIDAAEIHSSRAIHIIPKVETWKSTMKFVQVETKVNLSLNQMWQECQDKDPDSYKPLV